MYSTKELLAARCVMGLVQATTPRPSGWPLGQTVSEATPVETATVEPAPLIPDSVQGNQQRSEIDGKRHPGRHF
jgi:hypothetical protein